MTTFDLWLLLVERGRFDHQGFNDVFRTQLAELLPHVTDAGRRASLEAMQDTDFVGYILAALRNAGFADQQEREQAAHDVVVYLLVQPGQLFTGYDAAANGPMEGRFRIAVQNAVRNLLRTRRRQPAARAVSTHAADTIPDRPQEDDEVLAAFREFLRREVGEEAVRLLDRRLDGMSLRQLVGNSAFSQSSAWALRRLMANLRDAALKFARRQGDEELLTAIERLTAG